MSAYKDFDLSSALPKLPDSPGETYRLWSLKIRWKFSSVPDDKQHLFGARVISECLPEAAANLFTNLEPGTFRVKDGLDKVLAVLDGTYAALPEIELTQVAVRFFRLQRNSQETNTAFATRYKAWVARLEAVVSAELKRESLREHEERVVTYRDSVVSHLISSREVREAQRVYDEAIARLEAAMTVAQDDGDEDTQATLQNAWTALGDRPEEQPTPVKPEKGKEPKFLFPKILLGALYLAGCGLGAETCNSIIRNAKGRTELEDIVKLLRSTEFNQPRNNRHQNNAYVGDSFDDDSEQYDNEWSYGTWQSDDWNAEYDDFDAFNADWDWQESGEWQEDSWFGEDTEEYDALTADLEIEDDDEELFDAMVGYQEARKKLGDLKKARGFYKPGMVVPNSMFVKKKGFRKGKGKGKSKSGKGKGKSFSKTGKSHAPPFWKVQNQSLRIEDIPAQQPSGKGSKSKGKGKGSKSIAPARTRQPTLRSP
jgi:hypothetical protein